MGHHPALTPAESPAVKRVTIIDGATDGVSSLDNPSPRVQEGKWMPKHRGHSRSYIKLVIPLVLSCGAHHAGKKPLANARAKLLSITKEYRNARHLLFDFTIMTTAGSRAGNGVIRDYRVLLTTYAAQDIYPEPVRGRERIVVLDGSAYSDISAVNNTVAVGALSAQCSLVFAFLDDVCSKHCSVEYAAPDQPDSLLISRDGKSIVLTFDPATRYVTSIRSAGNSIQFKNTRRAPHEFHPNAFSIVRELPGLSNLTSAAPTFPVVP